MYKTEESFSWYSGWSEISPFFQELVPPSRPESTSKGISKELNKMVSNKILIPGIGNDASMVEMYDSGYTQMYAFDYAPEGIECARTLFGPTRIRCDKEPKMSGVDLRVADARELPYDEDYFDAVLEKGTLDAIFLSGGKDKELAAKYLAMTVSEFSRVVKKGGIVFSVTAACAGAVKEAFENDGRWITLRNGDFYVTEDGYASNNVDASIFAWERI